jgi:RNA polymerase sigma factor (sigma-70 family)
MDFRGHAEILGFAARQSPPVRPTSLSRAEVIWKILQAWRILAWEENLPDPQASPYVQVEQKAELHAVLAGLQKLPEIDRAALLMRAFDEMPYEEIVQALGISLSAVKVKIHRARLALTNIRHA